MNGLALKGAEPVNPSLIPEWAVAQSQEIARCSFQMHSYLSEAERCRLRLLSLIAAGAPYPDGVPRATYESLSWPIHSPFCGFGLPEPAWMDCLLSNQEYQRIVAAESPQKRHRLYRARRTEQFVAVLQDQRWQLRSQCCALLSHAIAARHWEFGQALRIYLRGESAAIKALACARLFRLGVTGLDQRANRYLIRLRDLAASIAAPHAQDPPAFAQSA